MHEQFLGGFENLGLGFSKRTKREAGEERGRRKKMSENGSCEFYIDAWIGSVQTRSSAPAL